MFIKCNIRQIQGFSKFSVNKGRNYTTYNTFVSHVYSSNVSLFVLLCFSLFIRETPSSLCTVGYCVALRTFLHFIGTTSVYFLQKYHPFYSDILFYLYAYNSFTTKYIEENIYINSMPLWKVHLQCIRRNKFKKNIF